MKATRNLLIGILAFLVLAGVLVFVSGIWPGSEEGGVASIAIGGPFSLEAPDGTTVTDKTYRNQWQLIYFGYTLCPDACPTTLNAIAGALQQLGPLANKVQPIFISIDPARDTPKVMGQYVKAFDPRIVGLTGSPDAIDSAARAFRVYVAKVPDKEAPNGYLMDHSSVIYVMRPGDGHFVATFTTDTSSGEMAERLKKFIANS
ncbi:MAG TPA: SCO family protein [Stellaceae bacterium]|nr:SCO family protein [Stellaceae bacterium]